jgi:hypothetical protein
MRVTSRRIPVKVGRARFGLVRARARRWPAPIVWRRPSCASEFFRRRPCDAGQRDEREPAKQEADDDDRARVVALAGEGDDHREEAEDVADCKIFRRRFPLVRFADDLVRDRITFRRLRSVVDCQRCNGRGSDELAIACQSSVFRRILKEVAKVGGNGGGRAASVASTKIAARA